jgi:transcriptional antiterminator RfaH
MVEGQLRAKSEERRAETKVANSSNYLNQQLASISDQERTWHVLRTKTKCEKFVRDRLRLLGVEAFVPLRKRTAKYNRKVKVYELPLITCYTFVRLDKSRRNQVLALPYVQGMLRIDGHDCIVSDREIQWLQKISGTELDIKTETLSMKTGDKVVLAYGQLAGIEGVILSQRSKHEVVVALESIGLQMVVQVDTSILEHAW